MPLYVKDLLAAMDVRLMDCETFGAYMRLLIYLWAEGGAVPFDFAILRQLFCVKSAKKTQKLWQNIAKKFQIIDGKIRHERVDYEMGLLEIEAQEVAMNRLTKVQAGRRGAAIRWHTHDSANSKTVAGGVAPAIAPSLSYIKSELRKEGEGKKHSPELQGVLAKWAGMRGCSVGQLKGKDVETWGVAVRIRGAAWCELAMDKYPSVYAGVIITEAEKQRLRVPGASGQGGEDPRRERALAEYRVACFKAGKDAGVPFKQRWEAGEGIVLQQIAQGGVTIVGLTGGPLLELLGKQAPVTERETDARAEEKQAEGNAAT